MTKPRVDPGSWLRIQFFHSLIWLSVCPVDVAFGSTDVSKSLMCNFKMCGVHGYSETTCRDHEGGEKSW